jgi:NADPH2:quinone reductase
LPQPTSPATRTTPLVVYGGSSAVGVYAIQLARRSNIHPIVAVAGKARDYVSTMLDFTKGDAIVDYRQSDDAVVQGIKDALKGRKVDHAFDATSDHNSYINLAKVVDLDSGKITVVLPPQGQTSGAHKEIPDSIRQSFTIVGDVHRLQADLGYLYCRYFTKGLEQGWFKAQNQEECGGGLEGVEGALKRLKAGSASATKFVFKVADTPGIVHSN